MSVNLSLSDRFIIAASGVGYYADDNGQVFRPDGSVQPTSSAKSGHLRMTLYVTGLNDRGWATVLVHRFVAYCHFGYSIFEYELIRHLNDIPWDNRPTNLARGSKKENRADIPREVLSAIAKRNAPALVARSRKLTDVDVQSMRLDRDLQGLSYGNLAVIYGVSTMTAYRAVNKQSWKDI